MWLDRALTPNKTVFMNWQMLWAASVSHTQNVLSLTHITPKKYRWSVVLGIDNKEQNWFWRNKLIIGCTLTDKYYINNAWVMGIFWLEHFVAGLASGHCIITLESKTNKQENQKRSSPTQQNLQCEINTNFLLVQPMDEQHKITFKWYLKHPCLMLIFRLINVCYLTICIFNI